MGERAELIRNLEGRFRRLSLLLYDTSVEPARADAEVAPMLDENVRFTDPWQQASGRAKYRLGLAGFHAMLRFDLEIAQASVQLSDDGAIGDMIAVVPVAGWLYRQLFRPGFSWGFLAASWLSARARGLLPDFRSNER